MQDFVRTLGRIRTLGIMRAFRRVLQFGVSALLRLTLGPPRAMASRASASEAWLRVRETPQ